MNFNFDTNINNINYLRYMQEQENKKRDQESKDNQNYSWCKQVSPSHEKEDNN